MIELNTTDPAFDMAMEVLCSLPQHPISIRMSSLRDDLGLKSGQPNAGKHLSVQRCLQKLRLSGRRVVIDQKKGFSVSIHPADWKAAKAHAQDYWDRVYGEGFEAFFRKGKHAV